MEEVVTAHAPKPVGHYAQGIRHGGFVFISGQVAIDPESGELRTGSIEEQTRQALQNMLEVARAGGSDLERIVKVTVFLADQKLWPQVNQVYAEFFGTCRPARSIIPCGAFGRGLLIEIEAIAAVNS